jgi:5-methylcytosine-specific restriction endonuclease McrA
VTEKWIQSKIEECNNQCKFCKKHMEIYITDATVHSNITVDRIDNSKAHTIKNSQICCLNCNLRKGARY